MTLSIVHPTNIANNDVLNLIPWAEERNEAFGHDPRSAYVENFWLGTLGPTTTWFLRYCAGLLDCADAAAVDLRETATSLGIGHQGGARSAMVKTVARACHFRAARPVGSATLAVRLKLPQLSPRQLARLPEAVQRRHEEFLDARVSSDGISRQLARARRLALSFVECGDEPDEVELHLARLRFHPAVGADAVRWAWSQHHGRVAPDGPEAA